MSHPEVGQQSQCNADSTSDKNGACHSLFKPVRIILSEFPSDNEGQSYTQILGEKYKEFKNRRDRPDGCKRIFPEIVADQGGIGYVIKLLKNI